MRFAWLSLTLGLGLLLQLGCDSKNEPEPADLVVPVTPGEPETPPATPAPDASPAPDAAPAAPADELKMPPADAAPADAAPSDEPALQAPPAEDAAAADTPDEQTVAANASEKPAAPKEPKPMTIGSVAPPLDIEHWVSEGFEPVTEFTEGNVYVVEFWATWCGPCVASMPHLAETQKKYKDQGVRLISISDEKLDTVEKFLTREAPAGEEGESQTFGELTSAYSLTTDPDRSCSVDYMQAANQNGIPTAFIVGKTGQIEWIGHPMRMDEPLAKVVDDSWDREAYQLEFQMQEKMSQAQMLARRGQAKQALELINGLDTSKLGEQAKTELLATKMQILAGMEGETEQFVTVVSDFLAAASEPMQVYMASYFINHASNVHDLQPELLKKAIAASEKSLKDAEPEMRPAMLDTVAHLHENVGNLDAAIAAQQEAVETADGRMKDRLKVYLNELNDKKNPPKTEEEPAADEEPAAEDKPAAEEKPAAEAVEETTPEAETADQPAADAAPAE